MFTLKTALIASSLIAAAIVSAQAASARTVWYGPGSGPYSPYANYQGWAQVQPRWPVYRAPVQNTYQPNYANGHPIYRCVPNVGNTGPDGICR